MNCQSWLRQIIPIIQPPTPSDDEFKTADKVECIGFLLGAVGCPVLRPFSPPVMAVQFDQIMPEISSEAKNEMNCDSESRLPPPPPNPCSYPAENHPSAAEGFPLFQVTSLRRGGTRGPIAANKASPSCLTQGSSVRGSLIGLRRVQGYPITT